MIVMIDNYDSFSYNLVQMAGSIQPDIRVIRNDAMTVDEILDLKPSHIILSPGPGRPKDAGICEALVRRSEGRIPILGVCLGHQGICEVFGAEITHARHLMHGKQSRVRVNNRHLLFLGLDAEEDVGRYHSLAAAPETIPECLEITAVDGYEEVMAVAHRSWPVFGIQFHPESILTPKGWKIMENFLNM